MRHFCTYFNAGYLDRALVLVGSMRQWVPDFSLHVLAFDERVEEFFEKGDYPEIRVENLRAFEARNLDVAATKSGRSRAEYFFTCTGAWILDVLNRNPDIDILTYLDADLCFLSSAEPVFKALGDKSILIAEHNFVPEKKSALSYGRFNVGLLTFRNSATGCSAVKRWRDQCVAWCYDRLEDGRFADQKYLDEWPDIYGEELVVAPPGINAGPWSLHEGGLIKKMDGQLEVQGHPLVVFHFQGVRFYSAKHYYLGFYFSFDPTFILSNIYDPYLQEVLRVDGQMGLKLSEHGRYELKGILYRMATGYWVGRPWLCRLMWLFHRYVCRLD